jgi:uncharacterized protein (TIGR02099 family)
MPIKQSLQKLTKYLAYFVAAIVVFLAVTIGLFRLMLPQFPEYQKEIKNWVSTAIGMRIEFTDMNARWRLNGPELNFYDAELIWPDTSNTLLDIYELSVDINLIRLLVERKLVVDQVKVKINDASIKLRQTDDGAWLLQDIPLEELIDFKKNLPKSGVTAMTIIGQNLDLNYWPPETAQAIELSINRLQVQYNKLQLSIEAIIDLPQKFGEQIVISASLRADATTDASDNILTIDTHASSINLDNLKLLTLWLPEKQRAILDAFRPSGTVREFELKFTNLNSESFRFDLSARLEEVGISPRDQWPSVSGFSGWVHMNQSGGQIDIKSSNLRLDMPDFFAAPIDFNDALGTVTWRQNNDTTIIFSDNIHIKNADLDMTNSLQVSLSANGDSPLIDVLSNWSISKVSSISRYLPSKLMEPRLYAWFDNALIDGRVPRGIIQFTGPLDKFPFEAEEGSFRIEAQLEDSTLKYHPSWPAIEQVTADINIDNMRFYSTHNTATTLGNNTVDARIEIADMRKPLLTIDAYATGTLETIRQLSLQSPIANVLGNQLDRIQVDGDASFDFQLSYPIWDKLNYTFTTNIRSNNGLLGIEGFTPLLSNLTGLITVTRDSIQSESLTGNFLGGSVNIDLTRATADMPKYSAIVSTTGMATAERLIGELGLPLEGLLSGSTRYDTKILFPYGKADEHVPLYVSIETNLEGLAIKLPMPAGKTLDEMRSLSMHIEFPEPDRIDSSGSSADDITWSASFLKEAEQWDFNRGMIVVGNRKITKPETRGLHIAGKMSELRLQEWLKIALEGSENISIGERIRSIDLLVDDLYVLGQHFSSHRIQVDRGAEEWFVELDGDEAIGSLVIPYDLSDDKPLLVKMEKLSLPGADDNKIHTADLIDPRTLPPISIKANEFTLGLRHFGRFEAEFSRTEMGLEATSIMTKDDSFSLSGTGRWIVKSADDSDQRSYLTAKLVSTNVKQTTQRLNYQPGIIGKDMEIDIDVNWSGGPRENFVANLDGNIGIRLGPGQLDEIEPGAGRVFGLMSIVALPRRLSLDFSDVFAKGFGFDEITGIFRIINGVTFTCDLMLKGPAANIAIVGQAGLVSHDYKQIAIVNAKVGNTLPVVGVVVAGPQVAAALLVFSQIFKKPLQDIGQIYYSIDGSWDEPVIAMANAEQFTTTYKSADCIQVAN